MLDIDMIVVLYQRNVEASETLRSLRELDFAALDIRPIVRIWHNAADPDMPEPDNLPEGWHYHPSADNTPLSVVYNTLYACGNSTYLMVFDQDTMVDFMLFAKLMEAIRRTQAEVLVARIEHDGQLISPGQLRWIQGRALASSQADRYLPRHFAAMMSGLCIKRLALQRLGLRPFDERLNFYGIDTRLCRDMSRLGSRAYFYDARLQHDSALRSQPDPTRLLTRRLWLWRSWLNVFDANLAERLGIRFYVLYKLWHTARDPRVERRFFSLVSEVFR